MATGAVQGGGDSLSIGMGVGQPMPAEEVVEAQACGSVITGSLSAAVAVPVRLTATVTSQVPLDVSVAFLPGSVLGLTDQGSTTLAPETHWSVQYTRRPQQCKGAGDASVRWSALAPNSAEEWLIWIIVPEARTASDPTGAQIAGSIVLNPVVKVRGQLASPAWKSDSGNVVNCSDDSINGTANYVALVPGVAVDHGCRSSTAGSALEQANDRMCQDMYPVRQHSVVRRGDVTVYNSVASMYHVCTGFGTKEKFELTPARTCLLIAVATNLGAGTVPGVRPATNLCDSQDVLEAVTDQAWLGYSKSQACDFFGGVLATGLGVAAAGAALPATGPAAPVVGVATYKALSAGLTVTCGGVFGGEYLKLGEYLEGRHQNNIATAIAAGKKCLAKDDSSRFDTADCPD